MTVELVVRITRWVGSVGIGVVLLGCGATSPGDESGIPPGTYVLASLGGAPGPFITSTVQWTDRQTGQTIAWDSIVVVNDSAGFRTRTLANFDRHGTEPVQEVPFSGISNAPVRIGARGGEFVLETGGFRRW